MTLEELNALSPEAAAEALALCCGSERWTREMAARRPFASGDQLFGAAEEVWWSLDGNDWLQAFSHHPRIGERAAGWAKEEQSVARGATDATLRELAELNAEYERRFDHVFLVSATGRSADAILAELRRRLDNPRGEELHVAAGEQAKITRLRLEKLVSGVRGPAGPSGPTISTHVLDVSVGSPAAGISVTLARFEDGRRTSVGAGVTDADGRVRDLAQDGAAAKGGTYELTFETGAYFRARGIEPFHPRVTVIVDLADTAQHYHVPLLVSPFGYTTYRGS